MTEWNGCYCGEFAQPTIAPDEFGETCFHEHDKCEVPTTKVPDQTVIRLLKQKVDALTERARKAEAARDRFANQLLNEVPDSYIQMKARALDAEAAIARVRDMCDTIVKNSHRFQDAWDEDPTAAQVPYGQAMVARHILQALDGERDE